MEFEIMQNGGELTVAVKGRLDTASAPELQAALEPLLGQTDQITYDFSGLAYISSAGLRVINHVHKNLRMGGRSCAIHCNSVVREVFTATGFTEFMTVE